MSYVWMSHRGHRDDRCVLASILFYVYLRKGDLFVLRRARVATNNTVKYLLRAASVVEVCTLLCYCLLWLDA